MIQIEVCGVDTLPWPARPSYTRASLVSSHRPSRDSERNIAMKQEIDHIHIRSYIAHYHCKIYHKSNTFKPTTRAKQNPRCKTAIQLSKIQDQKRAIDKYILRPKRYKTVRISTQNDADKRDAHAALSFHSAAQAA